MFLLRNLRVFLCISSFYFIIKLDPPIAIKYPTTPTHTSSVTPITAKASIKHLLSIRQFILLSHFVLNSFSLASLPE